MILKRNAVLSAASNAFTSRSQWAAVESSTSSFRSTRHTTFGQSCSYATVAGDAQDEPTKTKCEHVWPSAPKGHVCPTPYQIFDLKHNQEYSKARYYELVKIYHPDLQHGTAERDAAHLIRIERYRLIVAAHAILSDPVKRSAYDRFGSGWNGKAEVHEHDRWDAAPGKDRPGPFSRSWQQSHNDPIWQNATWEDWERWHERRAGTEPREPVFMKNGYFVACVMVVAAIGGTMNYSRAQDAGTYFIEQRDLVHDRAAKDLRRVRQDKSTISSRQDRIDYFVRQREATMGLGVFNVEAIREEQAKRLLPKDVCRSEEVSDKDG